METTVESGRGSVSLQWSISNEFRREYGLRPVTTVASIYECNGYGEDTGIAPFSA